MAFGPYSMETSETMPGLSEGISNEFSMDMGQSQGQGQQFYPSHSQILNGFNQPSHHGTNNALIQPTRAMPEPEPYQPQQQQQQQQPYPPHLVHQQATYQQRQQQPLSEQQMSVWHQQQHLRQQYLQAGNHNNFAFPQNNQVPSPRLQQQHQQPQPQPQPQQQQHNFAANANQRMTPPLSESSNPGMSYSHSTSTDFTRSIDSSAAQSSLMGQNNHPAIAILRQPHLAGATDLTAAELEVEETFIRDFAFPRPTGPTTGPQELLWTDFDSLSRAPLLQGGFGVIRTAVLKKTGATVIFKGLAENESRMFEKEVAIMHKVNHHQNFVRFMGTVTRPEKQTRFMVMEYYPLGDLSGFLRNKVLPDPAMPPAEGHEILTWKDRFSLALDIATGLAFLLEHGYYHGDLHTRNVLIGTRDNSQDPRLSPFRAMLTDFGLSRVVANANTLSSRGVIGIKPFVAPERLRNPRPRYNGACDIFSMGVIFWQLTSGRQPFSTKVYDVSDRETPVPGTPDWFEKLYRQAWSSEPEDRPTLERTIFLIRTELGFGFADLLSNSAFPAGGQQYPLTPPGSTNSPTSNSFGLNTQTALFSDASLANAMMSPPLSGRAYNTNGNTTYPGNYNNGGYPSPSHVASPPPTTASVTSGASRQYPRGHPNAAAAGPSPLESYVPLDQRAYGAGSPLPTPYNMMNQQQHFQQQQQGNYPYPGPGTQNRY